MICFVRAIYIVVGVFALCCGIKAFENKVCKFALHETRVDVSEDT
jgi:uncharacterized membrane protein YuzA (DUF378 family)